MDEYKKAELYLSPETNMQYIIENTMEERFDIEQENLLKALTHKER